MIKLLSADYDSIIKLIENQSKVLDLGCGSGILLKRLIEEKKVSGRGVEINEENIIECVKYGIPVFQGDIDEGLAAYQDKSYDYVILNQTLQVIRKPDFVLKEMLRVGKRAIVSFPNFANWKIRLKLLFSGRMPKTKFLPFEWYDTPNIHLLTIKDFKIFCRKHNMKIFKEIYIKNYRPTCFMLFPNLFAEQGLFVISD